MGELHERFGYVVQPSESRLRHVGPYVSRLPWKLLCEQGSQAVDKLSATISEMADIALHDHKEKVVLVTHPLEAADSLKHLKAALQNRRLRVHLQELHRAQFAHSISPRGSKICCMDWRLGDTPCDGENIAIAHAGGPLVLDPLLKDVIPPHHTAVVHQSIVSASQSGVPVQSVNAHLGARGSKGCGMRKALSHHAKVRDVLRTPRHAIEMIHRVRDDIRFHISSNCKAVMTLIFGDGTTADYDLDDGAAVADLLAEPNLEL